MSADAARTSTAPPEEGDATVASTSLEGKVAIVSGGGGGIGRETVKVLVAKGARVVVADLSAEAGEATVEYAGGGDHASFVLADVTSQASMSELVATTVERYGRLDVAHNNAGVELSGPSLADVEPEDFDRTVAVNLKGVWLAMRAQIPVMLEHGGGSIVNTASGLGIVAYPGQAAYVASKHGVVGLTRAAALEYSSRGIRVNAMVPGVVRTPMLQALEETTPGFTEGVTGLHPIGRLASPREIAEAVAWLASDVAAFVTGTAFVIDGGYTAQ